MSDTHNDTAGVVAPPPLIFVSGLALGWLLDRLRSRPPTGRGWRNLLSGALVGGGGALSAWAFTTMRRAHTSPEPWHPTSAIVAHGPFRYTRNPIYLGFTLIYLGLSAWRNSLATLLVLPGVLVVMQRGVIDREERYLERKFGHAYTEYKGRVRRWL